MLRLPIPLDTFLVEHFRQLFDHLDVVTGIVASDAEEFVLDAVFLECVHDDLCQSRPGVPSFKRIECPVIATHVSLYRETIDWRIHNAISRHTLNWPEKQ